MGDFAPRASGPRRLAHSTGLRLLGFFWVFVSGLFVAAGIGLGLLGIAGGILVRVRPETQRNINYDPSTIALLGPVPFLIGIVLLWWYVRVARRIDR